MAYYHSMLRVCDYPHWSLGSDFVNSQKRAFASLAFGSSFMHGSHTEVGHRFDADFISIVSYTAYQAAVSGLNTDSSVVKEISIAPRTQSGVKSQEDIITMSINQPTREWSEVFRGLDIPRYELNFAALLTALAALLLTPERCVSVMTPIVQGLTKTSTAEFIVTNFMPEMLEATANIHLSLWLKMTIVREFTGMIIKILYAFVW